MRGVSVVFIEQALVVDAFADKRLYEQELARTRKETAFFEDQASPSNHSSFRVLLRSIKL